MGAVASGASSATFLNTYFFRGNDNRFIGLNKSNVIAPDFTRVWI